MQSYSSQRTEEVNRFTLEIQFRIPIRRQSSEIFLFFSIRLTILSIVSMRSANPIVIKQQLFTMNQETRVIIVHTTSYVDDPTDFQDLFHSFSEH